MENTNIPRKVKRGEIYLYDFGANPESIQNGVRPVLVVQCDEGNEASKTTIIAAMTTVIKKCYMSSHIVLGDNFGLKEPSMVMLEQIRTVNQFELTKFIGFWVERPPKRKNDIRCLCGKCLNDYKSNPAYIIRRLNPFEKIKHQCDKCSGSGYDYLIYDRSSVRR